ncbi:hypothetical protein D3C72_1981820 [compost metagenome]
MRDFEFVFSVAFKDMIGFLKFIRNTKLVYSCLLLYLTHSRRFNVFPFLDSAFWQIPFSVSKDKQNFAFFVVDKASARFIYGNFGF